MLLFFAWSISCFSTAETVQLPQATPTQIALDQEAITPETWRHISMEMQGPDSIIHIDLLRPIWWIEQTGAVVGESIDLSMPEMGVKGSAKVLAIMPTKADSRKNTDTRYKPVTGKFVHDNAEVINLYFTHQETEPLGVTPNHLLWSVTHGGWMHAGDLKIGDTVQTKSGTEKLTKKEKKPGLHTVYNLEVHQSHTYYVSNIGVLAHNDKPIPKVDITLREPHKILFIQDSIKSSFKNGTSIDDMINGLKSGKLTANDIPAIRIFERNGKMYTLDHRRLKAFQDANVKIRTKVVQIDRKLKNELERKSSTKGDGSTIKVRGRKE